MSGIKGSCNRPKAGKNIKSKTEKKFRNEDPEAKARYSKKLAHRIDRRKKK